MMARKLWLIMLFLPGFVLADIDVYPFDDPQQEARFRTLIEEFRCPKCQNQTLSDSNAPLAKDLRGIIYEHVQSGKSDQEIAAFLQERYGDFVLYRPPVRANTVLLWFGPFAILVLVMTVLIRRKRRQQQQAQNLSLSTAEQERLQAILRSTDTAGNATADNKDAS